MKDVEENELLQVFSAEGKPLEITANRAEVHSKGLWHSTIQCWCYYQLDDLLCLVMQERSHQKVAWPGYFDAFVAGHCDLGENPSQTCLRELKEEVGISITDEQIRYHSVRTVEQVDSTFINREFQHVFMFRCSSDIISKLKPNALEVSAIVLLDWNELIQLIKGEIKSTATRKYINLPTSSHYSIENIQINRFIPDQIPFIEALRGAINEI